MIELYTKEHCSLAGVAGEPALSSPSVPVSGRGSRLAEPLHRNDSVSQQTLYGNGCRLFPHRPQHTRSRSISGAARPSFYCNLAPGAHDHRSRHHRRYGQRANPAFATDAVGIPVLAPPAALAAGPLRVQTYVHVMAGVRWTGIDLFMALVLGPTLGGLAVESRAAVFERFTPKMTVLMLHLALVTIAGSLTLATRLGVFPHKDVWIALFTAASVVPALALIGWQFDALTVWCWLTVAAIALVGTVAGLAVTLPVFAMTSYLIVAALGIVTVLTVVGFGLILPGEVRLYLEMVSADPDAQVIATSGCATRTSPACRAPSNSPSLS
jgi:hypothetical protein